MKKDFNFTSGEAEDLDQNTAAAATPAIRQLMERIGEEESERSTTMQIDLCYDKYAQTIKVKSNPNRTHMYLLIEKPIP